MNTAPYGLSTTKVVREYPEFAVDSNGRFLKPNGSPATNGVSADADGDGIADAKWFEFADMRTSKGQRIYAAVRVIDNSGMINVNTAHSFNANTADGNSQMQINLAGLLKGTDTIAKLHQIRCGSEPNNWTNYKKNVIWDYNSIPGGNYLPFDISDELELRYRYCIDSKFISRFEVNDPCSVRGVGKRNFGNLYNGDTDVGTDPCSSNWRLSDWQHRIVEPNYPYADRRHLLTAYNLGIIYDRALGNERMP